MNETGKPGISFACQCGAVKGYATHPGPRLICMCDDCQTYAHFLGRADDLLDDNGGTDIVPVRPAHMRITQGHDQLACVRLGPRGIFRWYAACCRTPLANVMSPGMPYAGLFSGTVTEGGIGPVRARVQAKFGTGILPDDSLRTVSPGVILRMLGFVLPGIIRRQHHPSPFFDATGRPTAEPQVLSLEERNRLLRLCGFNAKRA